jgi:signal peptidase I
MKETNILEPTPVSPSKFSHALSFVWDFSKIILIALAIIIPVRYFLFQPFVVSGSSMEPNFSNGEYLIIDEISYRFRGPTRGEVLVIRFPDDPKQFFIKRVVGLPGEQIKIENGVVIISNPENPNGINLEEIYLPNQGLTFPHNTELVGGKKVLTLGENEYFMLGDNRLGSSDSRDWGTLETDGIVGKVFLRALPFTEFGLFQAPEYNL